MDYTFDQNLMRTAVSLLWTQTLMQACQEMFQKSYLLATPNERNAVEKLVFDHVGSNYGMLTHEFLAGRQPKQEPFGFQTPTPTPAKDEASRS